MKLFRPILSSLVILAGLVLAPSITATAALPCSACIRPPEVVPHSIRPYMKNGGWAYSDPAHGAVDEPLAPLWTPQGSENPLTALSANIPNAAAGFTLYFLDRPFSGYTTTATAMWPYGTGEWYAWPSTGQTVWLCHHLFDYFPTGPPATLYLEAVA